jgi:hypothetical protein
MKSSNHFLTKENPHLVTHIFPLVSPGFGGSYSHPLILNRIPRFCFGLFSDGNERGTQHGV